MIFVENKTTKKLKLSTWRLGKAKNINDQIGLIMKRVGSILGLNPNTIIQIQVLDKLDNKNNRKAYFSRLNNTIYIHKSYFKTKVISHEISHMMLHYHFPKMSVECHEILSKHVSLKLYS